MSQRPKPIDGAVPLIRDKSGAFVPGHPPLQGAGRPVGARTRFGEEFLEALRDDFTKHGKSVLERVRKRSPESYLRSLCIFYRPIGARSGQMLLADNRPDEFATMEDAASVIGELLDQSPELVAELAKRRRPRAISGAPSAPHTEGRGGKSLDGSRQSPKSRASSR